MISLLLLVPVGMRLGLDHDEHQFVASGVLLARSMAIPFRDYPYFHVPNLAVIYAALFSVADRLLLTARLFSVACSAFSLALIFHLCCRRLSGAGPTLRLAAATGAPLLVLANPLFTYTSLKAWNHALPVLLVLLALPLYGRGLRAERPGKWLVACGMMVGFAGGTRLSYAAALVPFACGAFLFRSGSGWLERLRLLAMLGAGAIVGASPTLLMFALAPGNFLFGNFEYAALNTLYRREAGWTVTMTLGSKIEVVRAVVMQPGNAALAVALLITPPWRAVLRNWRRGASESEFLLVLGLTFAVLVGSLAPTPWWYQYFYPPVPFAALGVVYGTALCRAREIGLRVRVILIGAAAVVAWAYGYTEYRVGDMRLAFDRWEPVRIHAAGKLIGAITGGGKVLTLAPILPLEGGSQVYKELATGPFAWRTARFVPEPRRPKLRIVSDEDLAEFLAHDVPKSVLVGFEPGLEAPLQKYARDRGYRPLTIARGITLWLAP